MEYLTGKLRRLFTSENALYFEHHKLPLAAYPANANGVRAVLFVSGDIDWVSQVQYSEAIHYLNKIEMQHTKN